MTTVLSVSNTDVIRRIANSLLASQATLCEIPSDYSGSLAKMTSLDIVGVFCALGKSN